MLGKLIKHEWKSTCKVGALMLFVMLLISFLGWAAFQSPMWHNVNDSRYRVNILDVLSIVTIVMYVFMLMGVLYGILIYLGVHFYRTMYTDQGYLTHTLPVGKHELLMSKIIVSSLWMLLIMLAMFLSVMILLSSLVMAVAPAGYTLGQVWYEIFTSIGELMDLINYNPYFVWGRTMAVILIYLVLSPFTTVTILFGAISAGQFFTRFRVVMAIICYIGILVVNSVFNSIIQNFMLFTSTLGGYMDITLFLNTMVSTLIAVGLYFVSWFVISKKLNME